MCLHLFHKFYDGESKIRRAFVTLTNLNDEVGTQLDLFENQVKKEVSGKSWTTFAKNMVQQPFFGRAAIRRGELL